MSLIDVVNSNRKPADAHTSLGISVGITAGTAVAKRGMVFKTRHNSHFPNLSSRKSLQRKKKVLLKENIINFTNLIWINGTTIRPIHSFTSFTTF